MNYLWVASSHTLTLSVLYFLLHSLVGLSLECPNHAAQNVRGYSASTVPTRIHSFSEVLTKLSHHARYPIGLHNRSLMMRSSIIRFAWETHSKKLWLRPLRRFNRAAGPYLRSLIGFPWIPVRMNPTLSLRSVTKTSQHPFSYEKDVLPRRGFSRS